MYQDWESTWISLDKERVRDATALIDGVRIIEIKFGRTRKRRAEGDGGVEVGLAWFLVRTRLETIAIFLVGLMSCAK